MLTIYIEDYEGFDESTSSFITYEGGYITLEHSLVAISKWEAIYKKPFLLKNQERTIDETIDYIKCMTVTENVPEYIYYLLSQDNLEDIRNYIDDKPSATTISRYGRNNGNNSNEVITSELIYYWMISYNIPIECQHWHIYRLIILIEVFSAKNSDEKLSNDELYERQRAINEARRMQSN